MNEHSPFPQPAPRLAASLADEAAPADQALLFAMAERTPMPVILTDAQRPDHPILFANQAFSELTGYAQAEILGANCRFLQGPDTDRAAVARLREALAAQREITLELLNYRKDGSAFWNALFLSPVHDPAGELRYFYGSQLDITRWRDMGAARQVEARRVESLSHLTGGIAHEFNNLLQVMLGHLERMEAGLEGPGVNHERLRRGLRGTKGAADRAAALAGQLLAFSCQQPLQAHALDLNDLLMARREPFRRALGEGVALRMHLAPALPACRLDPVPLEAALRHLLDNAREAMDGGGAVTLTTHALELSPEAAAPGGLVPGRYVLLDVGDTGAGMPPEVLARALDPFFTTKEHGRSGGLGLSAAYGFARQSGGTLQIASEPGAGTTVRLCFPAAS